MDEGVCSRGAAVFAQMGAGNWVLCHLVQKADLEEVAADNSRRADVFLEAAGNSRQEGVYQEEAVVA